MKYYEQKNKFKYWIIAIVIALPFILMSFMVKSDREINAEINSNFTMDALVDEIKCHDFKYPDIILAQAILETGHFKSAVFKENNNIFGMKQPKKRYTLCSGTNLNHGYFENWKQSIEDRFIYDTLYLKDMSRVQYKKYLDKVYAKGKNYSGKIEKIIKCNDMKNCFTNE